MWTSDNEKNEFERFIFIFYKDPAYWQIVKTWQISPH